MPMNQSLAYDLLTIADEHLPKKALKRHPELNNSLIALKQKFHSTKHGKGLLAAHHEPTTFGVESADKPIITYYDGDFTKNPPTGGVSVDTGSGKFEGGKWVFRSGAKLTVKWDQTGDLNFLDPLVLNITGTPTTGSFVNLHVNSIGVAIDKPIVGIYGPDGIVSIPVPATTIINGTNNFEFSLKGKTGEEEISITKIQFQTSDATTDVDSQIKMLSKTLARMGAENVEIQGKWPKIIKTTESYSALNVLTDEAKSLSARFTKLNEDMKNSAVNLQTFTMAYITLYMPVLLSETDSKDSKLNLLKLIRTNVEKNETTADDLTKRLQQYKTDCFAFKAKMNDIAKTVNAALVKKIQDVQKQIDAVNAEVIKRNAELTAAGAGIGVAAGLAVGIPGAVAVFCTTPVTAPFAIGAIIIAEIVCAIALIVSLGFLIDAVVELNKCADKLVDLNGQMEALLEEQKDIEQMLSDVAVQSASIEDITNFTDGFNQVWEFLKDQLSQLNALFVKWDGDTKKQPETIAAFAPYFATQMKPYFLKINDVLEAYINNFP